jgi:alpha,alpha-trehalase
MDERYSTTIKCVEVPLLMANFTITAAYQVGLTFLTSHMRRAVATCTSPELVFRSLASTTNPSRDKSANDALGFALDALHIL